jgi:hypothetical protein
MCLGSGFRRGRLCGRRVLLIQQSGPACNRAIDRHSCFIASIFIAINNRGAFGLTAMLARLSRGGLRRIGLSGVMPNSPASA